MASTVRPDRNARDFPDVDIDSQVLEPTAGYGDMLSVDKADLIRAVKRVAVNANPRTSAMALIAEGNSLTLAARDDDGNKAEEAIAATWSASRRLIVVNYRFLADLVAAYPAATCVFALGKDTPRGRSKVRLEDRGSGVIGVIPQMVPSSVGY